MHDQIVAAKQSMLRDVRPAEPAVSTIIETAWKRHQDHNGDPSREQLNEIRCKVLTTAYSAAQSIGSSVTNALIAHVKWSDPGADEAFKQLFPGVKSAI